MKPIRVTRFHPRIHTTFKPNVPITHSPALTPEEIEARRLAALQAAAKETLRVQEEKKVKTNIKANVTAIGYALNYLNDNPSRLDGILDEEATNLRGQIEVLTTRKEKMEELYDTYVQPPIE